MEERLSRRIVGHSIPEYMIEILIQDYAGTFLRMVVSRNAGVYDLSYEQNGYRRCMAQRLPSPEKFRLLELLYDINEENENHLGLDLLTDFFCLHQTNESSPSHF